MKLEQIANLSVRKHLGSSIRETLPDAKSLNPLLNHSGRVSVGILMAVVQRTSISRF